MSPYRVIKHIDNQVFIRLNLGKDWNDILEYLFDNVKIYKKSNGYIKVSESYLLRNWERIEWKKRLTTMLVIQSLKRVDDIKWIMENHKRFQQYGSTKMYKIISLKNKLQPNQL